MLLTNTPAQAESLLNCLEQAAGDIGLNINASSTVCVLSEKELPTLSGKSLKLVDQFTYLGSNISLTESDVNIHQAKSRNAFDRLSIIWKFDLFAK